MNIVQMILKLLTSGDTLNKIASALGIGQEQAGKAVSAAVPTLLAALAGAVSKPAGGANLANVLAKQNAGVLDNLSSLFSGGDAAAASQGSNLLGSLLGGLGGGALGQIGSVLSRFTGVNEGAINKLLGLLAPVVLGAIKKQSKGQDKVPPIWWTGKAQISEKGLQTCHQPIASTTRSSVRTRSTFCSVADVRSSGWPQNSV